jgi:hypothetical protein
MMDIDSLSTRLDPRHVTDSDTATPIPLSTANRSNFPAGKMLRGADVLQPRTREGDSATPDTVASAYGSSRQECGTGGRDVTMDNGRGSSQTATSYPDASTLVMDTQIPRAQLFKMQVQLPSSASDSQNTTTTNDTIDPVFTPPASEGGQSQTNSQGNGQDSSQESQLLQLSQLAAARERMPDGKPHGGDNDGNNGLSRKRMADGMVKNAGDRTSASPVRIPGHSRNTSTVSVASTNGSRIGEVRSFHLLDINEHLLTRRSLAVC